MNSPMQTLKCPNCGGSLNATGPLYGTKCPYCSTVLVNQDTRDFCACGRRFDAVCSRCGTRLCNNHSFCLQQFNLGQIIQTYAPHKAAQAGLLIRTLHGAVDPKAIHCSTCADAILETWIRTSLQSS